MKKSRSTEVIEDQRRHIVEKVIGDMKRGGLRWSEPYLTSLSPQNPVTGTVYKGGNRLHLAFAAFTRGYEDPRWCTFNQIRDKGWHLKRGAKAAPIEKWREVTVKKDGTTSDEKTQDEKKDTFSFMRLVGYWNVFNAQEIEGIPAITAPKHTKDYTAKIADDLIVSSRCPVREHPIYAGTAAYTPSRDYIMIAPRDTFLSDETFTRVLLHEMTHATGHSSALGRASSTKFGSPEYAEEELVAELGALFLCSDLGIQGKDLRGTHYENHVAYLKSWLEALEDDPAYLFKAASKADKADAFILGRYEDVINHDLSPEAEISKETSLEHVATDMRQAAEASWIGPSDIGAMLTER